MGSLIAPLAYSGDGSTDTGSTAPTATSGPGSTDSTGIPPGLSLIGVCKSCTRKVPNQMLCHAISTYTTPCGSELWGIGDLHYCLMITTLHILCDEGGENSYTIDVWSGVGSYCTEDGNCASN